MQFVDVDTLWKIEGGQMPEALKTESGNPRHGSFFAKWEQNIRVCVGGIGKVENRRDLLLVYLQVSSLPQLTVSSSGSSEDILKGYCFGQN